MPEASGATFAAVVTVLALSVLAVVFLRRRMKDQLPVTGQLLSTPPPRGVPQRRAGEGARGTSLRLADATQLYERAVIELWDLPESTKLRALRVVAHRIAPLVGALTVEDLPAIASGVRQVLVDENEQDPCVLIVWDDFVRWSHAHLLDVRQP